MARTKLEVSLSHKANHMRTQARTLRELAKRVDTEIRPPYNLEQMATSMRRAAGACETVEADIRRYLVGTGCYER